MKKKQIPVLANKENGLSYTIFLDSETNRVYRAFHREMTQKVYWGWFFLFIVFLLLVSMFNLPPLYPLVKLLIILAVSVGSILAANYIYNRSTEPPSEIFPYKEEMERYIKKGRKNFIIELTVFFIFLIGSTVCFLLFWVFDWLGGVAFAALSVLIVSLLFRNFSVRRLKLYMNASKYIKKPNG